MNTGPVLSQPHVTAISSMCGMLVFLSSPCNIVGDSRSLALYLSTIGPSNSIIAYEICSVFWFNSFGFGYINSSLWIRIIHVLTTHKVASPRLCNNDCLGVRGQGALGHRNEKVVKVTTLVLSGEVEVCLRRVLRIPGCHRDDLSVSGWGIPTCPTQRIQHFSCQVQ